MATIEKTTDYYIEKAFSDLFKVVFKGYSKKVAFRAFVAMDDSKKLPDVVYPAIEFASNPYVENVEGAGFGVVDIQIVVRSQIDDDPVGKDFDYIFANTIANIELENLVTYQNSDKISIKGVMKVSQTGISVDADSRTREKTVTYSVYLATIQKA